MWQEGVVRNWRGVLVLSFLALWPIIWFFSSLYILGFGGQCTVDVCGPEPTALETSVQLIYMIAPPVFAIIVWANWRRKLNKSEV
jgi:hypothetical protein